MDKSKEMLMKLMTMPRLISSIYRMNLKGTYKIAIQEELITYLVKVEHLSVSEANKVVVEMLPKVHNWVHYIMADILRIHERASVDKYDWVTLYSKRMVEEHKATIWKSAGFNAKDIGKPHTIADMGCGMLQFAEMLFINNKVEKYYAVDKRIYVRQGKNMLSNDSRILHINGDANGFLGTSTAKDITLLFMSQFLHCLDNPVLFMNDVHEAMPKLQTVIVIEPTEGKALDTMMDSYMKKRGGYGRVTKKFYYESLFGFDRSWNVKELAASDYHTSYIISKD